MIKLKQNDIEIIIYEEEGYLTLNKKKVIIPECVNLKSNGNHITMNGGVICINGWYLNNYTKTFSKVSISEYKPTNSIDSSSFNISDKFNDITKFIKELYLDNSKVINKLLLYLVIGGILAFILWNYLLYIGIGIALIFGISAMSGMDIDFFDFD